MALLYPGVAKKRLAIFALGSTRNIVSTISILLAETMRWKTVMASESAALEIAPPAIKASATEEAVCGSGMREVRLRGW